MPDKCSFLKTFLALLFSTIILYFGSLEAGFVSDDFVLVQRIANEGFYSSWGGEASSTFFRPLITLTYLLDHSLWAINPVGFHITNLFWHSLVGLAVFFLFYLTAKQLSLQKPCLYSLLTAVLFLSLASHSESVTWISGRTDVIASAFCITSLIFFYKQLNKSSKLFSIFALFFFSVGLLAKESIIITPLLWGGLLLYESPKGKKNLHRNLVLIAISFLIAFAYSMFRFLFNNSLVSGMQYGGLLSLSPIEVLENLARYLFRVFVPALPHVLRDIVLANPIIIPAIILAFFLPIIVLIHKKATKKQKRFLILFAGLFLASLIPVLGMKVSLFDSRSERFLYLPSIFASGFFTVLIVSLFKESKFTLIVFICFIVLQGIFLHKSNTNWIQAGRLCSGISETISEYDPDCVYIQTIPDNFYGAYVFRNGLNEAVEMRTGNESDYIVFYYTNSYGDSLPSSIELPVIPENDICLILNCVDGIVRVVEN